MGLRDFFKSIFTKEKAFEEEVLEGIEIEHIYSNQNVALDVVKRIQKLKKMNEAYVPEYERVLRDLTVMEQIEAMPKEALKELELMASSYGEGMLKKESFKKVVTKEHPDIEYLERFGEDITKVISEMKRIENNQRIVKRDLDMLEGEKADILYKRKRYGNVLEMLKVLLIVTGVLSVITALVFTALIYGQKDIMIPALIASGIIASVLLYIFVFRRYLIYEIKLSFKKNKRAVSLVNKMRIKYVSNQQYLDYAYSKYHVNCAEMLELRYDNLMKLKRNKERYKKLNSNIVALIEDIEHLLERYGITEHRYVTEHLDYFSTASGRTLLMENLREHKDEYSRLLKKNDKETDFMFNILKEVDPDITMDDIMNFRDQKVESGIHLNG